MTPSSGRPREPARGRTRGLARALLAWYRRRGRRLPWRETSDPYRVWVSEAMLQQTTVKAVVPYYERFLERYPDVASLAASDLPGVLAAWSGLGYYRRARHLKAAAEIVVAEHGGRLPAEAGELRALPGFGPYMAASVASIAFDRPEPPVDANVRRVASRLFALQGPGLDRRVAERLRPLFESASPRLLANALMDLGALVCLPREPCCAECPLRGDCLGAASPERYGAAPPRAATVPRTACALALVVGGRVWLERGSARLLEGFWDLPHEEAATLPEARAALLARLPERMREVAERAAPAFALRHAIMNRRITRHVHRADAASAPRGATLVPIDGSTELPLSGTARKCLRTLRGEGPRRLPGM